MSGVAARLIGQGAEKLPLGGAAQRALGPGLPQTSLLDSIKAATAQTTLPLSETAREVTGRQVGEVGEFDKQLAAINEFGQGNAATIRPAEEAFPGEQVTTMTPEAAGYMEPGVTMSGAERSLHRVGPTGRGLPTGNEVKVVERIGDPARPLHSQLLRVREGKPVVHKMKVTKEGDFDVTDEQVRTKLGMSQDDWLALTARERSIERAGLWPFIDATATSKAFRQSYPISIETSYGNISEVLAGDVLDFGGDIGGTYGIGGWSRRYEVMPDGSLIRFSRKSPMIETFYDIDKKTNQLVLKEPEKVINGWLMAPRRETSSYGYDLIDVEKEAAKPFSRAQTAIATRLGIDPEQVGMSIVSAGRARSASWRQRQEAGHGMLGKRGVDASTFYSNIKDGETMGNTQHTRVNRGPEQIKGRLRLAGIIKNFELLEFRAPISTHPLDIANYSMRDATIIKRWNEMAKMSPSMFDEQKRIALALLDVMPDEFVEGLALSIRNVIPGSKPGSAIAGQYRYDGAAGILTLSSTAADLQTLHHEFFHHLHTWIAPEDLLTVSRDWKQALMAKDTQNLISTLYWGYYQRIKTQKDLLTIIKSNTDLQVEWNRIAPDYGTIGATDTDWIQIIRVMQDEGLLPADFRKVVASDRPLPGGPVDEPLASGYPVRGGSRGSLYGNYPLEQALRELTGMAYQYTSPAEFLAETFGRRSMVALLARDLKARSSRNILNQIYDLLREWVVMAYNFAVRMGRKDTATRLFADLTSDKYKPLDDKAIQEALDTEVSQYNYGTGIDRGLSEEEKAVIDAAEGYDGAWEDAPMSAIREVRGATYGPRTSRYGGREQKSMGSGPFAEEVTGLEMSGWTLIDSDTHKEMAEMLSKRRTEWGTAVRGMAYDEPTQGPAAGLWQSPSELEPRFPGMPESVTSRNVGEFIANPEAFVRRQEFGPKVTNVPSQYTTNPPGTAPQMPRGASEQMKQDIWNEHRARQGPITVYTGADKPFTKFDMERVGKRDPRGEGKTVSDPGFFGRGAYTTTDYKKADRWSYGSGHVMATVIPPDAKFLRVTAISELYNKWGMQKVTQKEQDISSTLRDPEGFPTVESQAAYKKAIDTWTDKMIKEGWDGVEYARPGRDREFVLFHPEKYEFDPQAGDAADSPGAAQKQRFGGIFSTLNQRDFNYIEEVLRDRPFWHSSVKRPGVGTSYDDIDLHNMSNRHILNLLDELKRRARFFIDKRTGLKFLDEASTESKRVDSAEFRRDQRELLANVNKIREKIASTMKKEGQDTSDITKPWEETQEANKRRWVGAVNKGETDIWPDLAEEFGIEVPGGQQ